MTTNIDYTSLAKRLYGEERNTLKERSPQALGWDTVSPTHVHISPHLSHTTPASASFWTQHVQR